jgi:hypothetical protein
MEQHQANTIIDSGDACPNRKDFYPHLRRSPMLLARVGKGNPPHFSTTEGRQTRVIHSEE